MYRYERILVQIRTWIASGILKPGDRLPSVREMSKQTGFSAVTVQNAYAILESEGVVTARPRSGYYLNEDQHDAAPFPNGQEDFRASPDRPASTLKRLYRLKRAWHEHRLDSFGHTHLSDDLLPRKEMITHMLRALRDQNHRPSEVGPVEGESALRKIIAKRVAMRGQFAHADDVMVTSSAQSALNLCLDVVTSPGDTVIIESPGFFPLFGALRRRQLNVIEIYSHPDSGLDPDQLGYLLQQNDISACILMPVHHFPTGVTCSNDALMRILELCGAQEIPIIEYDIYGELGHGVVPASSLKKFDHDDLVLQIGSFSETLGPRYGMAWIINQRFSSRLVEQFFLDDIANLDGALQSALIHYFQKRSYDRHLRTLREELTRRMRFGMETLRNEMPRNCIISEPTGGFMCWMRVSSDFDSLEAAFKAVGRGISIAPGSLFSVTGSFRNFIGLNLSCPWSEDYCRRLGTLSDLIRARTP
ncbi:PLP-dependent aminotransferase family protein [Paralimibaculum aggregatum]|uniref:aminotransferase-like domain-containing protein n=1 Tax=Paralimibaculum aggregatum TaxID=3036245 RepID=UPI002554BE73|nr:PLP-dependent aminotransferase family protein [Limibaculum sp. NKW23]